MLQHPHTCHNPVPPSVTKNPCLHPGDIRVLRATDFPALRHLVNVVVFPRNVSRWACGTAAFAWGLPCKMTLAYAICLRSGILP